MSNEQLAILLNKYQILLDKAIGIIEMELPEKKERRKTIIGTFQDIYPILDDFTELLSIISDDIERLKKVTNGIHNNLIREPEHRQT